MMIYLLFIASFAVFQPTTALKCHFQFGMESRVLALALHENDPEKIPQKMLSTPDMELECTQSTDVCAYVFKKDNGFMKGCTSSCEELKQKIKDSDVTCCNTDMCNKGSLFGTQFSDFGELFTNAVRGFHMRSYKF